MSWYAGSFLVLIADRFCGMWHLLKIAPAHGASSKFWARKTTLWVLAACRDAGARGVFDIVGTSPRNSA